MRGGLHLMHFYCKRVRGQARDRIRDQTKVLDTNLGVETRGRSH